MMMKFGLHLFLATGALVPTASGRLRHHKEGHDTDAALLSAATLSRPQRQGLTIHTFQEILFSEAGTEYGSGDLTEDETNHLWDAASDYEWSRAIDIEQENDIAHRKLGGSNIFSNPAIFPFLVCDPDIKKPGYECRQLVASHFGHDLMPVSNSENMTCFIVSSWASHADSAPSPLIVHPFMPEAKLQKGIAEEIMHAEHLSHRLYSVFCPSQSASLEDSERLVTEIMSSVEYESSTNQRRFLQLGRGAYDAATEEVLNKRSRGRSLLSSYQVSDDSTCAALFSQLHATAGPNGDSFTIDLPSNDTLSAFPDATSCLLHLIERLSVRPEICSVGIIPDMTTMNEEAQWIVQSGVEKDLPFFDKGITGKGEVVACSDSGLDTEHCYFWDADGTVPKDGTVDLSKRKVVQYVGHADRSDDYYGHGTHVVGSILGRRSDDGRTEQRGPGDGIAIDAKVAFFDIGITNSWYLDVPTSASALLDPGRNAGAKIHSASWGSDDNGYGFEEREFDAYLKQNDDFMIVIAAGNAGPRRNTVGKPATCKNAISVGSSQNGASKDRMSGFSSRGPTQDGRIKPDIVAPGDEITSAAAGTTTCDSDSLFPQAGTSMAAPVVSGTLALIRQYFKDGFYPSGAKNGADSMDPSGQLVKAVLLNGAQTLAGLQPYDINQNFGRVSLIDSLPLDGENNIKAKVVDRKNIQSTQVDTIVIDIDKSTGCAADEISVTLAWADPPAFTNCANCVLNDLDLYVTKEGDARTYFANGKNGRDTTNNAERVRVPASDGDRFTIHVEATNLQEFSQDYALVVTGCLSGSESTSPGNPGNPPPAPSPTPGNPAPVPSPNPGNPAPVPSPDPGQGNQPNPSPIGGPPNTIQTLLDANTKHRYFGNFFEVDAVVPLSVYELDIHTAFTGNLDVSIWTKQGTYVGYEQDESAWTKIGSGTIQGRGQGSWTPIPCTLFDTKVPIAEFSTQAFYVRLSEDSLLYSPGANRFENGDAIVKTGASIGPSGVYSPRTANVVLHYKTETPGEDDALHTPEFGFGQTAPLSHAL